MSTWSGGTPKPDESTDKLRECENDRGVLEIPKILQTSYVYGPREGRGALAGARTLGQDPEILLGRPRHL